MTHPATATAVTSGTVTSTDGTTIGYRRLGTGPGIVLLHGAMSSGYTHLQLGELLADRFTVYLPDRRGRGLSGPYRRTDDLQTEIDDLAAVLSHGGVHNVFGVSSAGDICLAAALQLPAIQRLAVFEPALLADPAAARALLVRFDRAIADGDLARALAIGMKGAQMGPALLRKLPEGLLARLTTMAMNAEAKKPSGHLPMRELAPALRHDLQVVAALSGQIKQFVAITADVLLLGGSKSPQYLKDALDEVQRVLPRARRVELSGLDHAASWNKDRGGRPDAVAHELRRFFT